MSFARHGTLAIDGREDREQVAPKVRMSGAFLIVLTFGFSAWGAEPIAGSVKTAQGSSMVRRGAETLPVHEGMHLLVDDILQTSADGRLGVIFQDGTRISVGPGTELKIDRFVYEPAEGRFGLLLRLTQGVLTYISGKIAHFSPESVSVQTPVGVVGLRGTHFAVSIEGMQEWRREK
jgi:hypothetical protein